MMKRLIAAAVCAGLASTCAQAQEKYPSRQIRLLVGYAPGGATDLMARALADQLSRSLGQTVLVDNRPGATSNIASEIAAKSAPDGYTLLMGTIANATSMTGFKHLGYDTMRDFTQITQTMTAPSVLSTAPSFPAKNLRELLALAKARPGIYSFASTGIGSSPHLAGELLKMRTGIDIIHVPYKGGSPAMTDLLGGQVTMSFMTAVSALPYLQSGKLGVIGVAAHKRMSQLPNVPTIEEGGVPDFEVSSWNGLFAPAKTPAPIVEKLWEASVAALKSPQVREKIEGEGGEPGGQTPAQFRAYVQAEIEKWGKVIKAANVSFD
ncbi:MAG: Tripartite tricarboxylate transporter family receptor [Betaproteobacteria bacterium]|nr:Tripartite tricarboxylate transporter family receptor [Betaproteobacteria bacterium]